MTISIITATYNAAPTIADCLASVRSQTVPVEHIIIDGASTDVTLDIISRLNSDAQRLTPDNRLRPLTIHHSPFTGILSEPDNGIYDAMNKGIRLATGDIIGILNADDFYASPDVLAKVAAVFEDPAVEACYGDLEYVRNQGKGKREKGKEQTREKPTSLFTFHDSPFTVVRYWQSGPFTPDRFRWGWMPPHPTFFVRRSVYERFGLFRLDMGSAADYELMLRFLLRHRITTVYIPEVLVRMRVGGASNATLTSRIKANRMDRRAWEVNGLKPYPWTLLCKPLRKLPQYFLRQC